MILSQLGSYFRSFWFVLEQLGSFFELLWFVLGQFRSYFGTFWLLLAFLGRFGSVGFIRQFSVSLNLILRRFGSVWILFYVILVILVC